jgi:plastocyanin
VTPDHDTFNHFTGARTMTRLLACAVAALLLSAGCGDSTNPNPNAVTVQDNSFSPSSSTIAVGEAITWTWAGSVGHNVTWDTGSPAASPTQTSGTYQRTFAQAGTFGYHCTIHGGVGTGMSGTVTVQ